MTPGRHREPLPSHATGTIAMATAPPARSPWSPARPRCRATAEAPLHAAELAAIVDLVGYGIANFFEGTRPGPVQHDRRPADRGRRAPTPTQQRRLRRRRPGALQHRQPGEPCGGPPVNTPPSVSPTPFPIQHTAGTTAAIRSSPPTTWRDRRHRRRRPARGITVDPGTAAPPRTITVTVADTVAAGDHAVALTLADGAGATTAVTVAVSVVVVDECGVAPTHTVMQVQGAGATSPLVGQTSRRGRRHRRLPGRRPGRRVLPAGPGRRRRRRHLRRRARVRQRRPGPARRPRAPHRPGRRVRAQRQRRRRHRDRAGVAVLVRHRVRHRRRRPHHGRPAVRPAGPGGPPRSSVPEA